MHRVVVHVPDAARVRRSLKNVGNLLDDLPGGSEVVLVLNGDAVEALVSASDHAGALRDVMARGVRVAACQRSLRSRSLDPADLVEGVLRVPGGVAEVVRLEGEGYAYLRP